MEEYIAADPIGFDHHQLLAKLQNLSLDWRLNDPFASLVSRWSLICCPQLEAQWSLCLTGQQIINNYVLDRGSMISLSKCWAICQLWPLLEAQVGLYYRINYSFASFINYGLYWRLTLCLLCHLLPLLEAQWSLWLLIIFDLYLRLNDPFDSLINAGLNLTFQNTISCCRYLLYCLITC